MFPLSCAVGQTNVMLHSKMYTPLKNNNNKIFIFQFPIVTVSLEPLKNCDSATWTFLIYFDCCIVVLFCFFFLREL